MSLPGEAPDLTSLDLLVSVAETGSLARAGARHRLTQPAASMRIRTLERRLRLELLERSPTGSRLTPAGEAVVGWAHPVLEAAGNLLTGAAALRNQSRGHLRVAASLTVAEYLLPSWLVGLRAKYPDVSVALEVRNSAEVLRLVAAGGADLGFVEGLGAPHGLRFREICEDELVVVVAPGHPWARRRRSLLAAELAATPLVTREQGSGTREVLDGLLARAGTRAVPAMELGSTSAVKAAVLEGQAPAVLSHLTVAPEVSEGRLVVVPVADLALRRSLRVVWRAGHRADAPADATRALITLAASAGRGRPRDGS